MKILHVITGLTAGGAERSLHTLLQGGLNEGFENHVLSLGGEGEYGPKIAELGVPLYTLNLSAGRPSPRALLKLRRIVRDVRPDIIQGWMYHGNLAATVARGFAADRPKLVWNIRQSLYDINAEKRLLRIIIRLGKALSGRADVILYNSHVARRQHEVLGYDHNGGDVIPNGFDTNVWRPNSDARDTTRKNLGLKEQDLLVGLVARYHPMKDVKTFLRALAPLMAGNEQVHCITIGRDIGPQNPELAADIAALPEQRAHFLGQRLDIPEIMPGLDLLCLSSCRGEGFPNVLGEASACGVPSVATDVGDSRYVLGERGYVVPVSDPKALGAAISEILSLPEADRRSLGRQARLRIKENFSLKATVDAYRTLYNRMMEAQ